MLTVGGLRLALEAGSAPCALPPYESAYADFLQDTPEGEADTTIVLHVDDGLPPIPDTPSLFHHRGQWHVRRTPEGLPCWPLLVPAGNPRPRRVAFGTADLRRVDLHVSREMESGPVNPWGFLLSELLALELFAWRPGALVHAAAVVIDGRAWLFPGRSGAGKSTIAGLLRDAPDITVLGDENLLLRPRPDGGVEVHGTPWHGTARCWSTAHAPLAGLAFLEHGKTDRFVPMGRGAAAARLLADTHIPAWSPAATEGVLDTVVRAVRAATTGVLAFRPEPAVCRTFRTLAA